MVKIQIDLGYLLSIISSIQFIRIYKLENSKEVILYEGQAAPALFTHKFDDMYVIYIHVDRNDNYLNILV